MEKLTSNYAANAAELDLLLGVGRSCDMVSRDYVIGGRRARLWVVDGFGSDSIIERMGAFWLTLKPGARSRAHPDAGVFGPVHHIFRIQRHV